MAPWNKLGSAIVTHDRHFGESGRGNGQFRLPRHITVLPDGNLCVSDSVNLRLQILTPEGEWVQNMGSQGSGPGELRGPSGIVSEGGNIFVVEGGNHRVQKLRLADGEPLGIHRAHVTNQIEADVGDVVAEPLGATEPA